MDWFHSEKACLDYLERLRWPKEFIRLWPPYRSASLSTLKVKKMRRGRRL